MLRLAAISDLSDNYFSGPLPSFLRQVKQVNADSNYFSGSAAALPCSDLFSVNGNCLSSVPSQCGGPAAQKTPAECSKFCGTGAAGGACSGKGVCVPDMQKMLSSHAFVPVCKCAAGFLPTQNKLGCVKK
ncbi:unnamed protein product [Closterium sp. NIES-64]|nr:unnamed protein product [Closterium sp. NIES-64]